MEQLIIDIQSESDATLIKELLKKFKNVEVKSFSNPFSSQQMKERIAQGLKDADEGRTTSLEEVKERIAQKIRDHRK